MLTDALLGGPFAEGQSLSGTSDQLSTNVFDAGVAKKLFAGSREPLVAVYLTAVGGTTPTFRARFVAADTADLATNPEILDDTGVSKVLAATDLPLFKQLRPANQQAAKRYYGVIFTQSGTSPTGTASAVVTPTPQSSLIK